MTQVQSSLIKGMNHTSITVSGDDYKRVVAFFTDGLGMPLLTEGPRDPLNMQQVTGVAGADAMIGYVQAPGHRIELINYMSADDRTEPVILPCDTGFYHLAFDVTDIDAVIAIAGQYGFRPIHDPLPVSNGPNLGYFCAYLRDAKNITVEVIGPRV